MAGQTLPDPPKAYRAIDLSKLRVPDFIETLSYEEIRQEMIDDLVARNADYENLVLESDPSVKLLEVAALRETMIRQRINDSVRATMLAYTTGADMDNLAALTPLTRLEGESDDSFRERIQLAPEGFSTAGSDGAYIFHAMCASADVRDVSVVQTQPGYVTIYVLSNEADNGEPSDTLLEVVHDAFTDDVIPLTDVVDVAAPTFRDYDVTVDLYLSTGPDERTVLDEATTQVKAYAVERFHMGMDVSIMGIMSAVARGGVIRAEVKSPAEDIIVARDTVSRLGEIKLEVVGYAT